MISYLSSFSVAPVQTMYSSPIDIYPTTTSHTEAFTMDTLSRSQLRRHASIGNSQQKRLSRVLKPTSAGSSPQDIQKRRHLASQITPTQRRFYYQQVVQDQTPQQYIPTSRPYSWHPSTMTAQYLAPAYTTSFVHGIPTPAPLPAPEPQIVAAECYTPEDPSGFYQQLPDYDVGREVESTSMVQRDSINSIYDHEPSAVFSPVLYPNSALSGSLPMYNTHTAPATPDFCAVSQILNTSQVGIPSRSESKELVGMGLYDGPDRNSWTLDSYVEYDHTTRPLSLGKGLKLEETWEPPEEEDKTDDEDDEDEEDDSQDPVPQTIQEQLEEVARQVPRLPSAAEATIQPFYFHPQQMSMAPYGMVL